MLHEVYSQNEKQQILLAGATGFRQQATGYFLRPSLLIKLPYERLLVVSRYLRWRRRSATRPRSPRRECLSLRFLSKCAESSSMRRVRTAICTSGEPVSESCRRAFCISFCFLRFVSINIEYHIPRLYARGYWRRGARPSTFRERCWVSRGANKVSILYREFGADAPPAGADSTLVSFTSKMSVEFAGTTTAPEGSFTSSPP